MKNFELLNCFVSVKGEMIRRTDKSIVGFCFRSFADRFTHLFAENTASAITVHNKIALGRYCSANNREMFFKVSYANILGNR